MGFNAPETAETELTCIADATGGQYFTATNTQELSEAISTAVEDEPDSGSDPGSVTIGDYLDALRDQDGLEECKTTIETLTGMRAAAAAHLTTKELRDQLAKEARENQFNFVQNVWDSIVNTPGAVYECSVATGERYGDILCDLDSPFVTRILTFGKSTEC